MAAAPLIINPDRFLAAEAAIQQRRVFLAQRRMKRKVSGHPLMCESCLLGKHQHCKTGVSCSCHFLNHRKSGI